jgi:LuxR family maltose regulon positive regulatory protein
VHERQLTAAHDQVASRFFERSRAELLLALGEVHAVNRLVSDRADQPDWLRPVVARLRLLTGDAAQAYRVASGRTWSELADQRDRAGTLMLAAVAAHELGREQQAVAAFLQAHALCQSTGILDPYLVPARTQLEDLLLLTDTQLDAATLDRISGARPPRPERVTMVELSPREREVLHQMRRHDTAAAIARSLNVSVNTVRKQLVSLYAKLGVHDRAAALQAGERLGLLPPVTQRVS